MRNDAGESGRSLFHGFLLQGLKITMQKLFAAQIILEDIFRTL
jgi:hypothetical protein